MAISFEKKKIFLKNFQNTILKGNRLFHIGNHKWANRLFVDLYFDLEKKEWLDANKKRQLVQVIVNSYWMYLNTLIKRKDGKIIRSDIIKYVDVYNRFLSFLSKLDDLSLFNNFAKNLLKILVKMEDLSTEGITKFINSYSVKVREREEYQELVELQILLMFLRNSVLPSEFYDFGTRYLSKTLYELEPNKRALFLCVFLENINIKYQLMEDSQEFVRILNKVLANNLPSELRDFFGKASRIPVNQQNFSSIFEDLEALIYYMNNTGLDSWIIIVVSYIFSKIQKFQSFEDAIRYIRKFIEFSINRNKFELTYMTYDFLEDILMYKSEVGYNKVLIEWWMDACNKFVNKNEFYLIKSLEKLNSHLRIPHRSADIFHFFYSCNYLWKTKSQFFSIDAHDFWCMMFYRALFEEKDFNLAKKIIPHLEDQLQSHLTGLEALYDGANLTEMKRFSYDEEFVISGTYEKEFIIKKMVLRISENGAITYRLKSPENQIIEGKITTEYWNDAQIIEIYNDIFNNKQDHTYNFSVKEFGQLLYIFLPKFIRKLIKKLNNSTFAPQVYLIVDKMTIPFQFIYVNDFFMLKNSSSYKIGEPSLGGIAFEEGEISSQKRYNVIIIESLNSRDPVRWSENNLKNELLFPFREGLDELKHIVDFFSSKSEINEVEVLTGRNSTRERILSSLSQGSFHIIHFVGNIFYSDLDPKNSMFLTNDINKVSFNEIYNVIIENKNNIQPIICCNTQIFDINGKRLNNAFLTFSEITTQFDYNHILGVIARSYPIFNKEVKELVTDFYVNLLNGNSQGVALLKARQEYMSKKSAELTELRWSVDEEIKNIALIMSSFELYGKPWEKL